MKETSDESEITTHDLSITLAKACLQAYHASDPSDAEDALVRVLEPPLEKLFSELLAVTDRKIKVEEVLSSFLLNACRSLGLEGTHITGEEIIRHMEELRVLELRPHRNTSDRSLDIIIRLLHARRADLLSNSSSNCREIDELSEIEKRINELELEEHRRLNP